MNNRLQTQESLPAPHMTWGIRTQILKDTDGHWMIGTVLGTGLERKVIQDYDKTSDQYDYITVVGEIVSRGVSGYFQVADPKRFYRKGVYLLDKKPKDYHTAYLNEHPNLVLGCLGNSIDDYSAYNLPSSLIPLGDAELDSQRNRILKANISYNNNWVPHTSFPVLVSPLNGALFVPRLKTGLSLILDGPDGFASVSLPNATNTSQILENYTFGTYASNSQSVVSTAYHHNSHCVIVALVDDVGNGKIVFMDARTFQLVQLHEIDFPNTTDEDTGLTVSDVDTLFEVYIKHQDDSADKLFVNFAGTSGKKAVRIYDLSGLTKAVQPPPPPSPTPTPTITPSITPTMPLTPLPTSTPSNTPSVTPTTKLGQYRYTRKTLILDNLVPCHKYRLKLEAKTPKRGRMQVQILDMSDIGVRQYDNEITFESRNLQKYYRKDPLNKSSIPYASDDKVYQSITYTMYHSVNIDKAIITYTLTNLDTNKVITESRIIRCDTDLDCEKERVECPIHTIKKAIQNLDGTIDLHVGLSPQPDFTNIEDLVKWINDNKCCQVEYKIDDEDWKVVDDKYLLSCSIENEPSPPPATTPTPTPTITQCVGFKQTGSDIVDISGGTHHSISMNSTGDLLVIGSPYLGADNAGVVRVYEKVSENWIQKGSDIVGDQAGEYLGWSVDMTSDGLTIVAGAHHNNDIDFRTGQVKIYEWSGTDWQPKGDPISGVQYNEQSGRSVSINSDGAVVAIGVPYWDNNDTENVGAVRIYEWSGSAWNQRGTDIYETENQAESGYGISLNALGDIIAIGTHRGSTGGFTKIYEWSNSNWNQKGSTIDASAINSSSGWSVSVDSSGGTIVIGEYSAESINGLASGRVRIFEWSGSDWSQKGTDIDGVSPGEFFGYSVDINADGNSIVVGAPKGGKVRAYDFISGNWTQYYIDIQRPDPIETGFDVVCDFNASTVAVVSTSTGDNNPSYIGVYDKCGDPVLTQPPTPAPTATPTMQPEPTPTPTPTPSPTTPPQPNPVLPGNEYFVKEIDVDIFDVENIEDPSMIVPANINYYMYRFVFVDTRWRYRLDSRLSPSPHEHAFGIPSQNKIHIHYSIDNNSQDLRKHTILAPLANNDGSSVGFGTQLAFRKLINDQDDVRFEVAVSAPFYKNESGIKVGYIAVYTNDYSDDPTKWHLLGTKNGLSVKDCLIIGDDLDRSYTFYYFAWGLPALDDGQGTSPAYYGGADLPINSDYFEFEEPQIGKDLLTYDIYGALSGTGSMGIQFGTSATSNLDSWDPYAFEPCDNDNALNCNKWRMHKWGSTYRVRSFEQNGIRAGFVQLPRGQSGHILAGIYKKSDGTQCVIDENSDLLWRTRQPQRDGQDISNRGWYPPIVIDNQCGHVIKSSWPLGPSGGGALGGNNTFPWAVFGFTINFESLALDSNDLSLMYYYEPPVNWINGYPSPPDSDPQDRITKAAFDQFLKGRYSNTYYEWTLLHYDSVTLADATKAKNDENSDLIQATNQPQDHQDPDGYTTIAIENNYRGGRPHENLGTSFATQHGHNGFYNCSIVGKKDTHPVLDRNIRVACMDWSYDKKNLFLGMTENSGYSSEIGQPSEGFKDGYGRFVAFELYKPSEDPRSADLTIPDDYVDINIAVFANDYVKLSGMSEIALRNGPKQILNQFPTDKVIHTHINQKQLVVYYLHENRIYLATYSLPYDYKNSPIADYDCCPVGGVGTHPEPISLTIENNNPAYGCGNDIMPTISWDVTISEYINVEGRSITDKDYNWIVKMVDSDNSDSIHLYVDGIPGNVTTLSANNLFDYNVRVNDFGVQGYTGPFPPAGTTHTYRIYIEPVSVYGVGTYPDFDLWGDAVLATNATCNP